MSLITDDFKKSARICGTTLTSENCIMQALLQRADYNEYILLKIQIIYI